MPINNPRNDPNQPQRNKRRSFDSEIFDIFVQTQEEFMKLSATEKQVYNTGGLSMEKMFYNYFMDKHGYELATKIDTPEFSVYFDTIKKKGYTFNEILDKAGKLHDELKPARNEMNVLNEVMTNFEAFCTGLGATNLALVNLYTDFAAFAHLNPSPNYIGNASLIKNIEDSYIVRDDFLQANLAIALSDQQKENAKHILNQGLEIGDITEKIYIQAVINKISATLNNPQKIDFDAQFLKLTAEHSDYNTLIGFEAEWGFFVTAKGPFTAQVQSDLDRLKVDFGDIKSELISRRIATQDDFRENISKRDDKFKTMFGKILIPKVFEEAKESKEFYFSAIENIKDSFTGFPPYLNQLMKTYPYREGDYAADPEVNRYWTDIQTKRTELEAADISAVDKTRLNTEILELERNLNQKRWNLYADYVITQDPTVGDIFKRLVDAKFDFGVLSDADKTALMKGLILSHFQTMKDKQVLEYLNVNPNDFEDFVADLMDLSEDHIVLPTPEGSVDLKFAKDVNGKVKKEIMGGGYEQLPEIKDISRIKDLPMALTFAANSENVDFFENSILFDDLFVKVDGQKIAESYKVTLKAPDGTTLGPGYLSSVGNNNKTGAADELYFFTKPLNVLDKNQERKEIHYNGEAVKMKVGEGVQNEFSLELNAQDKELTFTGSQIGKLLLGYTIGEANLSRPSMTEDEKNELEKKVGSGFSRFKDIKENNPLGAHTEEEESPPEAPETAVQRAENFKKAFEGIAGKEPFRPGVSFVGRFSDSKYPGEGGRWVEFKVTRDLGNKMEIELNGIDFPLASDLEGQKHIVDKSEDVLNHWSKNSFKQGFFVAGAQENGKAGFQKQLKNLKDSKVSDKGIDIFSTQLGFDGRHFVLQDERLGKKGQVIDHFQNDMMKCQIHNKSNGKFQVDIEFNDLDDKGKDTKYTHSQTMNYYQLMLFLAEKTLMPVSKEQLAMKKLAEKQAEAEQGGGGGKRKWYTFAHIKGFASAMIKGIKDQREKRLEEKTADLTDWMVGDKGLYRLLSTILPGKIGDTFDLMDMEHQEAREDNIKKKIESWKERIEKTPDRGAKNWYHIHVEPIVVSGDGRKNPHKTAGAMLAMINKGGLYMGGKLKPGDWVKLMFGPQVHGTFMQYHSSKLQMIEQARTGVDSSASAPYLEELGKLEVKFINDILSQGDMGFGNTTEERASYGKAQRKVWSKWFGKELETSFGKESGKAEFEKKIEDMGAVSYEYAESQYLELIGLGAYQEAFPYLKAMLNNTKNVVHVRKNAMYTTSAMLSGIFNNAMSGDVRKLFYTAAKSNLYAPLAFITDPRNALYMKTLLDLLTDGSFSGFMNSKGYTLNDFSNLNVTKSKKFIDDFSLWRNSDNHGKQIMTDMDSKSHKVHDLLKGNDLNTFEKATLEKIMDQWQEANAESIDDEIAKNPAHYMNTSGLNMDRSTVVRFLKINNGIFDDWDARLMWGKKIPGDISTENLSDHKGLLSFTSKKFLTYFQFLDSRFFVRALATAKAQKLAGDTKSAEDILEYMIRGQVIANYGKIPKELDKTLHAFKQFFFNNLQNFDAAVVKDMEGDDAVKNFGSVYKYANMEEYKQLKITPSTHLPKNSPEYKKLRKRDDDKYINKKLYEIDRTLERKHMDGTLNISNSGRTMISRRASGMSGANVAGVQNYGT